MNPPPPPPPPPPSNDDSLVTMVACDDCGHLVPEHNLAIHHATACGARARPLRQRVPTRQAAVPTTTTATTTTPTERDTEWSSPHQENDDHNNDAAQCGVIDLVHDDDEIEVVSAPIEWPCPRCTLLNPSTVVYCNACNYHNLNLSNLRDRQSRNENVRDADPIRRERLVQDYSNPPPRRSSSPRLYPDTASFVSGGALLGSVLGAAGAYMRGRNVGSGALEGAVSGAVSGAVMDHVLSTSAPRRRPVSFARSSTANGHPAYPSLHARSDNEGQRSREQQQPRASFRVVYRMGPSGMQRVVSSSSSNAISGYDNNITAQPRPSEYDDLPTTADTMRSDDIMPPSNVRSENDNNTSPPPRWSRPSPRWSASPEVVFVQGGSTTADTMRAEQPDEIMQLLLQAFPPSVRWGGGVPNIDGMSYEQLLQAFGNGMENRGADESVIASLPTAIVDKALPGDANQCLICLEDFEKGDRRKTLPCLHGFHTACADKWLRTNGCCPICKHSVSD